MKHHELSIYMNMDGWSISCFLEPAPQWSMVLLHINHFLVAILFRPEVFIHLLHPLWFHLFYSPSLCSFAVGFSRDLDVAWCIHVIKKWSEPDTEAWNPAQVVTVLHRSVRSDSRGTTFSVTFQKLAFIPLIRPRMSSTLVSLPETILPLDSLVLSEASGERVEPWD